MKPPVFNRVAAGSVAAFTLMATLSACDPRPPAPKTDPGATTTSPMPAPAPPPMASAPASQ